jgi:hypothetical protein
MALLFCDGFDIYTKVSELTGKGWQGAAGSQTLNASIALSASGSPYGGQCIIIGPTANGVSMYKPGVFTYANGYTLNCAYMYKHTGGFPSQNEGSTNVGGLLLLGYDQPIAGQSDSRTLLSVNTTGKLTFMPFGGNTLNATTGNINLCDGVYHWIEMQVVLTTAATGSVKVYVDGVLDLNLTNLITVSSGTPQGEVGFGSTSNNGAFSVTDYYDDVVMWDNTGTTFNTFPIGPQRIYTATPNAAGALSQFTPSAGANYAVAAQAYSGAAYLTATAAGQSDLYATTGLGGATPSQINAVAVNTYANNPAAGFRKLQNLLQSKGVTVSGPSYQLTASSVGYQTIFHTDSSGAAWTTTTVAGMQVGVGAV